jgi:hypothetical protein
MSATKYNFELNQGETFDMTIGVVYADRRPYNLTDYIVRGMIRDEYNDPEPIVELECSVYDAANGKIRIQLSAAETAELSFTRAYYDIEIESPTGVVTRVLQGIVALSLEATK